MKKIALEEHFITRDFLVYTKGDLAAMKADKAKEFESKLLDFHSIRINDMDKAGIDVAVLSLTDPGIQGIKEASDAIKMVSKTNDYIAETISTNSGRFRAFAQLAMQSPDDADKELERCVKELQFVGALINGQTGGHYLDEECYYPFWEKVQQLDVPIYLHPGSAYQEPYSYKGYPELSGAFWGWTVETATHALRLVTSGLFDRYPNLKLILGHMGETLPYLLWRLDSRWEIMNHSVELKKKPSQYLQENFYITTSGMCANAPLLCAVEALGEDKVLFSTDYPYESIIVAAQFMEKAPLSDAAREKIAYKNASTLLKINM